MKSRILLLRKDLGMTQDAFAEKLNLSKTYVWMMEKGERVPSERTLSDISRLFNVNEEWLKTGKGEMYKPQTKNQELVAFMNSVMSDIDDSFRKRLILAFSKFDDSDWETFEKFIDNIKTD